MTMIKGVALLVVLAFVGCRADQHVRLRRDLFGGPSLQDLQQDFPMVSQDEIVRFYKTFNGNNRREKLQSYVEWKNRHHTILVNHTSTMSDAEDWERAANTAYAYYGPGQGALKIAQPTTLRQFIFAPVDANMDEPITDRDGYRVLLVLANLMDPELENANDVYGQAMALYIMTQLQNNESVIKEGRFTILVDARPGRCWPNPNQVALLDMVSSTVQTVLDLHPDRLHQTVVYPIPSVAYVLYQGVVKLFLTDTVKSRLEIAHGPSGRHAPVPKDVFKFMDATDVERLETLRRSLWC